MNKRTASKLSAAVLTLALVSTFGISDIASAIATPKTTTKTVSTIVNDGDTRVNKRLTDLDTLTAKVSGTTKLSATNKNNLQAEITTAKTGLTDLKTKLDAETSVEAAKADDVSIVTGYRVYMVVVPKVRLVKVADNQLANEAKLLTFANLLQTKANVSADKASLSPRVTALLKTVQDNQTASQTAENAVLAVKPTDYNANHEVLKTQRDKLKVIQSSNVAAHTEGKAIAQALGYKV